MIVLVDSERLRKPANVSIEHYFKKALDCHRKIAKSNIAQRVLSLRNEEIHVSNSEIPGYVQVTVLVKRSDLKNLLK